ncbi:SH3 domain-containing protein [Thioclava sp. GXIMD4216]|uniref:SH3 domain-containing protein n=1 Tax=Thioclava sp. GXIMD4216 TaxID=3131929 RepID=UPI0030D4DF53
MLKLTFNTLVALFLVMVIAGREDKPAQIAQAPATGAQAASGLIQAAVLTDETVNAALVTPAAAATVPQDAAAPVHTPKSAAITRAFPKPMPGPALRSSPEYRDLHAEAASTFGQETPADMQVWRVTAGALNVRSGPAASYQRVDGVTRGEEVQMIAQNGGWAKIRIEGDGIEGWVSKRFLSPAN